MPRGRDEMQVNVAGLRRNIKNLAHNYSDAQVKVREATSNDPWGPSSTLMAEIADLTYNVMAFTEIMQMIWKRLNDHGKNWRHVYKALVLLEYLLRTGSDRVALQCKENIYAIQTLKDFQYMEEGKDQGLNVREKAKQLVILLKDEERLKAERERAMKAKQRFAQSASGFGSDAALDAPSSPTYPALTAESAEWTGGRETEMARPLTAGEEELQLQLALAMSREEAEREERRRRSDDVRLQLALSQSQQDFQTQEYIRQEYFRQECLRLPSVSEHSWIPTYINWPDDAKYWPDGGEQWPDGGEQWPDGKHCPASGPEDISIARSCWLYGCYQCLQQNVQQPDAAEPASHLLDLLDVNLGPSPAPRAPPPDPWQLPPAQPMPMDYGIYYDPMETSVESWTAGSPARDPWAPAAPPDPWAPTGPPPPLLQSKSPTSVLSSPSSNELEQFDALSQRRNHNNNPEPDPFDLTALEAPLSPVAGGGTGAIKKSPSAFLGENSSLVNLERLLQAPPAPPAPRAPPNPFAEPARLFAPPQPAKLSINELKQQQMGLSGLTFPSASPAFNAPAGLTGGPAGLGGAAAALADPWAPAAAPRASSPWSPQHQRHTPNPFLS